MARTNIEWEKLESDVAGLLELVRAVSELVTVERAAASAEIKALTRERDGLKAKLSKCARFQSKL